MNTRKTIFVTMLITASLIMAIVAMTFASEEQTIHSAGFSLRSEDENATEIPEEAGDSSSIMNLFSELLSGDKEDTDEKGDSSSIMDLFSGLLSGIKEGAEDANIDLDDLKNLFSSLMESSGGESMFNAWVPDYQWIITTDAYGFELPEEVQDAYDKAMEGLIGVEYMPLALLETQVVSGMNYRILCASKVIYPDAEAKIAVVTIYQDLQGDASVTDITDLDLNVIYGQQGTSLADDDITLSGAWTIPEEAAKVQIPETFVNEIQSYDSDIDNGLTHVPVAILGTAINDDNLLSNAVLCRAYKNGSDLAKGYEMLFMAQDDEDYFRTIFAASLDLDKLLEKEISE